MSDEIAAADPPITPIPYLFAENPVDNAVAARFFYRWYALQKLGWQRERALDVLRQDPSLNEAWREFARRGHELLTSEASLQQADKVAYLRADKQAALRDLYENSALLTPYVREVLLDGNIMESLQTLLDVYAFEQKLPQPR